ncbi:hypothetical protein [Cellulomonas endometrii]|uniref:hypothetical protein n=1 Tax=Cellulomonas endometrii TaxID=3036301 RepID=UPI0024ADD12A|nr:hypothetical protein [Cellulomonas endometrii]
MSNVSFTDNHQALFTDAILSPKVVATTRALTRAIRNDLTASFLLRTNPYTVGALIVAVHMHNLAACHPGMRWGGFRLRLTSSGVLAMLWGLSPAELTFVSMTGHINDERADVVRDCPSAELVHMNNLVRELVRVSGRGWLTTPDIDAVS